MASTNINQMAETLKLKLDEDQLTNCMRCGFCLPACPTFRETGIEAESPRGRIALMKAVHDGLMDPDQAFQEQMDHCLGCRACEPVCPADVKYGQLIEQARDAIQDHAVHPVHVSLARKLFFRWFFPKQSHMRFLGLLLVVYQKSGLRALVRWMRIMKLFPASMREMEQILPDASFKGVAEKLGTVIPAKGAKIATVGLFRGCIMDVLFTKTNMNTAELLSKAGFEVIIPKEQNCCGALHAHSGEKDQARQMAKRNIAVFQKADVDYVVSNAGGCGAILVEYDHLLHDDPEWEASSAWFAKRVKDVSQLLMEKGRLPEFAEPEAKKSPGAPESSKSSGSSGSPSESSESSKVSASSTLDERETIRVTYQDSCHLRNVMKSGQSPRNLIRRTGNIVFTEMKEADRCCGSAGIYNITQPQMADQILSHKMVHANGTHARYLLTSNPGCLLQMKLGIHKYGRVGEMEAMHIVDFLAERSKHDA